MLRTAARTAKPAGTSLAFMALAVAVLATGACDSPADGVTDAEVVQEPLPIAYGWLGRYQGRGSGEVDGEAFTAEAVELRISLDADSVALASCPACVTVTFGHWFARANLRMERPADAYLRYELEGVARSLAINRFSGGGGTANVILVRAERWEGAGSDARLVAFGDFEMERR